MQNLLRRGPLARKQNIVIWHDVISNSLSKHRSNNYTSLSPEELIQLLFEFRNRIRAIVYVQRSGSPNILKKLFSSGILILDAQNKLLSQRKRRTPSVIRALSSVHPSLALDSHLLRIVTKPCFTPEETAQKQARQAVLPGSSITSVANDFLILVTLKVR